MLNVQDIKKSFKGIIALNGFCCSVNRGEILGLLGPNGAGKTTFFNIVNGFLTPDSGTIILNGENISRIPPYLVSRLGISRTFQNLRLVRQIRVLDNILLSFPNQKGERLGNVFMDYKRVYWQESKNTEEALALLERVGLYEKAEAPAGELSYGQQKLLSLVCCLASKPDVLLLDEPVAGIAPEMVKKILEIIKALSSDGKSVILIEHNIEAVTQICSRVIFMDAGVKVCEGTPEEIKHDPRVLKAYIK